MSEAPEQPEKIEEKTSVPTPESGSDRFPMRLMVATGGLLLAVGGSALLLAHCTRQQPTDAREADQIAGARLYRTYCGLCHGDEGEGYAADDANALANQDFLVSVSDEFLRENIREGHPGTSMAAYASEFGGPLDDREVEQLVAFIRSWQEEPSAELADGPLEGEPSRALPVYLRECRSCHGSEGRGDSALSLANPVFLRTASDGQIRYAIEHGRRGTPMPAFEGELQPETIDDLVALIRSWAPGEDAPAAQPAPEIGDGPVILNPDGAQAEFGELREGRYLPSAELAQAIDQGRRLIILDARPPSDYVRFHVVGAVPSPYYAVEEVMERLPRDGTWIIAYCACPHAASGRVMNFLRDHGFENTAVLDEGVLHWNDEGYPVVVGQEPGTLADSE